MALLAGGGLAIVLVVGIAFVALSTGGGDRSTRPAAVPNTPQPVVPEETVATLVPPATAVLRTTASARPSATKTATAKPSGSPSNTGPRVLTVSVTADPDQFTSCRGMMLTRITVRMTLSQPGLPVRYTINESTTVRRTASGTSFSETTQATVGSSRGEHEVRIAVSQPSPASATTSIEVDCGR
ncbi:hypothetical protein [Dactylosporangium sp. CA-233914]|uniref:hypothetical protein n=1 Tax=Dactylosporangium sp. CA-233914 TaxID=3239934 RepID=UPI003D9267B0